MPAGIPGLADKHVKAWQFESVMDQGAGRRDLLAAQEQRLRRAGAQGATLENGFETIDPWGTRLRLVKV